MGSLHFDGEAAIPSSQAEPKEELEVSEELTASEEQEEVFDHPVIRRTMPGKQYKLIPELLRYVQKGDFSSTLHLTRDGALAWFTENIEQITRKISYFLPRCSETEEDFLQVAYLSLINAHQVAERKNTPLEGVFWVTFHSDCCALVKKTKALAPVRHISQASPSSSLTWGCHANGISASDVLARMTARQQQVHELLLEGKSVSETARQLGIRKQSAHIIRDQGIRRAKKSLMKSLQGGHH